MIEIVYVFKGYFTQYGPPANDPLKREVKRDVVCGHNQSDGSGYKMIAIETIREEIGI